MSVQANHTGTRTVRGVANCQAYRITGSYLRPFTVYLSPGRTVYYLRHLEAGQALLLNANHERHWLAGALLAAGADEPQGFVGV